MFRGSPLQIVPTRLPCKDQGDSCILPGEKQWVWLGNGQPELSFCSFGGGKKKKSKLSFLKRQGPLRVKLHNSLFIFKVSGFLVAVAEKDKLIPHVASRQNPLCVPGEAHAAGVWVSGQSAQGKHGLEGAGADIG